MEVAGTPLLDRLLRRDRAITLAALVALCLLAWIYIARGAGLGMDVKAMSRFAWFPYREMTPTSPPDGAAEMGMAMTNGTAIAAGNWDIATWLLVVLMWWVMMIAMMAPSAAPAVLLYAAVCRHAGSQEIRSARLAPTGIFLTGYLAIWLLFSIAAAMLHWVLENTHILSAAMMGSANHWLSGGLLAVAGLYQLSRYKTACLAHCRAPASFFSRHWRPGVAGAIGLGSLHGAYCLGCCWALMLLLFVGGVMNLVWIAMLAIFVFAEKNLPGGPRVGRSVGLLLIAWGIATAAS